MTSALKIFCKQIRIHHWVKNLLVFAPLFLSGHFLRQDEIIQTSMLFVAFCLLASSIYIFNDILDRESDAKHPRKKHRPIASGAMKVSTGIMIMVLFLGGATALGMEFNMKTNILLSLYIVLNLGYSILLKHVPILDIFLVAAMYLIRVKAGGEVINLEISEWFVLVILFLALFLVIGKRRAELVSKTGEQTRKVLKGYSTEFLDQALVVVVSGTMLTYSLYSISAEIPYLLYSTFFVFFGIFRYLYIIYMSDKGEAPELVLFKDPWILLTVLGWAAYLMIIFTHALV